MTDLLSLISFFLFSSSTSSSEGDLCDSRFNQSDKILFLDCLKDEALSLTFQMMRMEISFIPSSVTFN